MSLRIPRSLPTTAQKIGRAIGAGIITPGGGGGVTPPVALPPVLVESFDSTALLAVSGPAAMATTAGGKIEGAAQLLLTGTGLATGIVRVTRSANTVDIDPSTSKPIIIRHDLGEDPEYHAFGTATVSLVDGSTGYILPAQDSGFQPGELGARYQILDPSKVSALVTNGRKNYAFRANTSAQGHAGGTCRLDGAAFYKPAKGKVCLFLDDMRGTHRSIVLPEMQSRGLNGATVFAFPDGMTGSNMRLADLQALDDYGFEIAINGTTDDGSMTAKASRAEVLAGLTSLRSWLAAQNFKNPGPNHTVYPNGNSVTPATEVVLAGVQSDGSDILTVSTSTGITVGMRVAGRAIPQTPFTLVKEIVSATQVRVWDGTNAVLVPAGTYRTLFRDISTEFGYGKLYKLLKDNGFTFCRTAGAPAGGHFMDFEGGGLGRRLNWPNLSISNNYPQATMLQNIDDCEKNGTFLGIVIHQVNVSDLDTLVDVGITKFRALVDRIKLGVDRAGLECITLNQAEAAYFHKGWSA